MIKKIAACLILFLSGRLNAQNTNLPVIPTTQRVNYTRVWTATAPDPTASHLITRSLADVKQVTQYYDGLGRPIQTVAMQASPAISPNPPLDIVTQNYYDPTTGKEIYQYLPFASNVATAGDLTADGNLKLDGFQQQIAFYNSQLSGQSGETNTGAGANLNWAYRQTSFEASPLNRALNTYAPGVNWVGSQSTTQHNVRQQNLIYDGSDNVAKWNIPAWVMTTPQQNIIPTFGGYYGAGALRKTVTTDEQGNQTIEFTDRYGQLILKKVQAAATVGPGYTGWLSTYYVYDDYARLRFIITPDVVTGMVAAGSWVISQLQADELCYRYEYDLIGNMIVKKTPGTPTGAQGEVWMIYDQRNRLVLQQDGNLRGNKQWEYIQYDNLDRAVVKGLITDPSFYNDLIYHVTNASVRSNNSAGVSAWPVLANYSSPELLSQTYYDDYSNTPVALPQTMEAGTNGTGNTIAFTTSYNTTPTYAQPITQTLMTQGLVTATKTEVLGSGGAQYLPTVNFYDDKGRLIQAQSINISGGKDIATNQYSWSGQVLRAFLSHSKAGTNSQTHLVFTTYVYDAMSRLQQDIKIVNSTINGSAVNTSSIICNNTYNALGQLQKTVLGNNIETLQYDYNVRGWLLGANRAFATSTTSTANYFGFDLGYDQSSITPPAGGSAIGSFGLSSFNGNLAGEVWKSKGDNQIRKYDYTYDRSGRLAAADFNQLTSNTFNKTAGLDFSASITQYDDNGNIMQMNQNGWIPGGSQAIDNLVYSYANNNTSDKLMNIVDNSPYNGAHPQSLLGDLHYAGAKTPGASSDYGTYDNNGNISKDVNRSVSAITYNYLNQPQQFTVTGEGSIQYQYDGLGSRLKKIVTDNSVAGKTITTTTSYYDGIVYKSRATSPADPNNPDYTDVLQFIGHEEGRVRFIPALGTAPAAYVFDYFLRDSRGNVRMVLTDQHQNDVYPAATLENASFGGGTALSVESLYYTINPADLVSAGSLTWIGGVTGATYPNNNSGQPNNDPYSNTGANSTQVYRLNGSTGDKTGLGITLKVMAGDQISILGKSFWHGTGATPHPFSITSALSTFINAFAGTTSGFGGHAVTGAALNAAGATTAPLITDLNTTPNQPNPTVAPKAAINWILFNDQFVPISINTDLVSSTNDAVKSHNIMNQTMAANGYLYVYCSNESDIDVFFDNLQVVDNRGPILEETHYYPAGLAMAGISDRAWNKLQDFYHYQGNEMQNQEFSDGTGLEQYDFHARYYDQQLGVWHSQDPASQFSSPYTGMANNWPNGKDPDGKVFVVDDIVVAVADGIINLGKQLLSGNVHNVGQGLEYFAVGAVSGELGLYLGPEMESILKAVGNAKVAGVKDGQDIFMTAMQAGISSGISTAGGSIFPLPATAGTYDKIVNAALKGATKGILSVASSWVSKFNTKGNYPGELSMDMIGKGALGGAILGEMELLGPLVKNSQIERAALNTVTSFGKSLASNWSAQKALFSKYNIAVGPLTMTFGKSQLLFQLDPNYSAASSLVQAGVKDIVGKFDQLEVLFGGSANLHPDWFTSGLLKTDNVYKLLRGWGF